jgi:hypothetical protein
MSIADSGVTAWIVQTSSPPTVPPRSAHAEPPFATGEGECEVDVGVVEVAVVGDVACGASDVPQPATPATTATLATASSAFRQPSGGHRGFCPLTWHSTLRRSMPSKIRRREDPNHNNASDERTSAARVRAR